MLFEGGGRVAKITVGRIVKSEAHISIVNQVSVPSTTGSQPPDLNTVPHCYHHLGEVFSKAKATSLPPHRPYDCAINPIPGATISKGLLHSISGPERVAMNEHIQSSLKAGLIRPSSPAAGAGFFFVGKKYGSLRPSIDYSPLNDITIENR